WFGPCPWEDRGRSSARQLRRAERSARSSRWSAISHPRCGFARPERALIVPNAPRAPWAAGPSVGAGRIELGGRLFSATSLPPRRAQPVVPCVLRAAPVAGHVHGAGHERRVRV